MRPQVQSGLTHQPNIFGKDCRAPKLVVRPPRLIITLQIIQECHQVAFTVPVLPVSVPNPYLPFLPHWDPKLQKHLVNPVCRREEEKIIPMLWKKPWPSNANALPKIELMKKLKLKSPYQYTKRFNYTMIQEVWLLEARNAVDLWVPNSKIYSLGELQQAVIRPTDLSGILAIIVHLVLLFAFWTISKFVIIFCDPVIYDKINK